MAEELENVQGQEQETPPVENENLEEMAGAQLTEGESEGGDDPIPEPESVPEIPTVYLALSKGKKKALALSMEGYDEYKVDGIYVTNGSNAIILSLNEQALPFGGDSEDLEEGDPLYDVASPSMSNFDGEWRTDFLINFFSPANGTALVEAKKEGWLPSGGELALIASKKEKVNELLEMVEGTPLSNDFYWTSQKFSNERMWSMDMTDGKFTLNNGCVDSLAVRAVKSADGYAVPES